MTIQELQQFAKDLQTINLAAAQDQSADAVTRIVARAKLEVLLSLQAAIANIAAVAATAKPTNPEDSIPVVPADGSSRAPVGPTSDLTGQPVP